MDDFFSSSRLFRFGLFEADVENAILTRKGVRVRLQEQPFRILAMLLERAGQVVTREELQEKLWPTGTYVDFEGSLNAALKRLRAALDDDADNPRFIETVPKRGYRFIAPVTVADSGVKSAATSGITPSTSVVAVEEVSADAARKRRGSRFVLRFTAIAAFALVIVFGAFLVARKKAVPRSEADAHVPFSPIAQRRSIAVLGFHNASGRNDDAWLSTALTEMLRTEIGAGDKLRVVPGEDVTQFRLTAPWSQTDSLSPATASRIGKGLEGDLLVLGSYTTLGELQTESLRVDFRLQDAQTGEILYEGAETGAEKQLFGLVAKVGVALRERLGLPVVTESEEVSVLSSLPSDPDADRLYSLGLEKMREDDVATARDLFLQAESISPGFPLVHLMLARAWGALGYDQKSRIEAKKAFDLSATLPQTDKLLAEANYYESLRDTDRAAAAYRTLLALHPDSVDYAVRLIAVLNVSGHREEGLAVVRQLRQLPPPTSEDPRIDYWEGTLVSYTNGPAARPFIDRAVAAAAARGQRLLYARFRLGQCLGLVYSDEPQTATARCQEAYDIFMGAGNRLQAADALRVMGDRRGSQGDFDGAHELYLRALVLLRQLGEHEKTGAVLNNMAVAMESRGQVDQCERLFREAKRNFEECGDTLNAGVSDGNIGDILLARGQLHEAERQYQDARKLLVTVLPNGVEYDLESISQVRLFEGDIPGAKSYADQAFAMAQVRGGATNSADAMATLAAVSAAEGDLPTARKYDQQTLEIRQKLGDQNAVAESQAELASLSIEEGKPSEAEGPLRKSLAEFQSVKATLDEIRAQTDLARVLLIEGKLSEAAKLASDAIQATRTSRDPSLKLPAAIADARIKVAQLTLAAGGKPDFFGPHNELQNAITTAKQLDYYSIECEARLALAEIELRTAPALGRSHLAILAEHAHNHGLELVARRAAELQKPSASVTKSASTR